MVQMALGNLSESNAMQLAQHIKALGRAIERAELEAGKIENGEANTQTNTTESD